MSLYCCTTKMFLLSEILKGGAIHIYLCHIVPASFNVEAIHSIIFIKLDIYTVLDVESSGC